jgi:uncharacterized iron-regulated membrane protein
MQLRKIIGQVHLWLGLSSGVLVCFLGITGCLLAFQKEIDSIRINEQYVLPQQRPMLAPAALKMSAAAVLPGKQLHSITYGGRDRSAVVSSYHRNPNYYYLVYLNPYSGNVLRVRDMQSDFFRVVLDGHFYLWLPPAIGKPIVASATLIFLLLLISGIVLWWPKNKAARKQRFSLKWQASWRRRNYDLHSVLGFYACVVLVLIAVTGLVWGFEWMAKGVYRISSGGKAAPAYYEVHSDLRNEKDAAVHPEDLLYYRFAPELPRGGSLELHFPETDSSAIEVAVNPDESTYWKTDYRYFDRYSLAELSVRHSYGRLQDAHFADKLARMNYDIHVGAIGGFTGKLIAFFASLIAASLPVTGFMIWRGRRKKALKNNSWK